VKKMSVRTYGFCVGILLSITVLIPPYQSFAGDKMRPEEIVAKHLEAIGAAETRASVHSRIVSGTVAVNYRSPTIAQFGGTVILASDSSKNLLAMNFDMTNYSQEKFGFDGGDVTVSYMRPGKRSTFGDFLLTHKNVIKEGLVGGVLSDAWPLLNLSDKKQKLEYKGTKKIEGKTLHELKYLPHGSSDLEISLFFNSETFQHERTEYTRVISAGLGTGRIGTGRADSAAQSGAVDASGSQRVTRYKMVEEFSDFKKEGGLTLPHIYKIGLDLDTTGGSFIGDWTFTLTDFAFNQPIPPATFNVTAAAKQ
jgi:hypothetical protein